MTSDPGAHAPPGRLRRYRWLGLLAAVAVLAIAVGYLAWSGLAARAALLDARAQIAPLRAAVGHGDQAQVDRSMAALRSDLDRAHRRTSGPVWWALQYVPLVGDDARAVRTVSEVGSHLLGGAPGVLAASATGSLRTALTPRHGRVDLRAVRRLDPQVQDASAEVGAGVARIDAVDASDLTGSIRPGFEELRDSLSSVDAALRGAHRALTLLPGMLGTRTSRTYALLTTSNAEVRATGGLIGDILLVRADQGSLRIVGKTRPTEIGRFPTPVLPQTSAEQHIYYSQIAEYPQDTNFTPEFPRTADLVREMLRRRGIEVDGVISVDTVFISYLLRAVGPLALSDGTTLTSHNAVSTLLNGIYLRVPTDAGQNAYFDEVAGRLFGRLVAGAGTPVALLEALRQGVDEGRIYVHDFDPAVQRTLDGTAAAGEIVSRHPDVPQVGVYLDDATGSKMSFYLRKHVTLRSVSCAAGGQVLDGEAVLTYTRDSPPLSGLNDFITGPGTFGTAKGDQLVLVRVYGPAGGTLTRLRLDGVPLVQPPVVDRGRAVSTVAVHLVRGQSVHLTWTARTAAGQRGDPVLSISPGLESVPAVTSVATSCAG